MKLTEGVLHRNLQITPKRSIQQCVASKEIRKFILDQLHNKKLAGHLGISKTCEKIRQRFYWPDYRKDVILWCRKCAACAQTNKRCTKAPLVHETVGMPLERVGIDIVGPLPTSEKGNSYILVVIDYFTRWVEGYSIPDQTALTVADKLVSEFITRFGVSQRLHSDQGTDFMSTLFRQMCRCLEIDQTRCTPYRPASNGLCERANQIVQHMLSAFVNDFRNNWEELLPYMLFAYRASVQESTGCSPNFLMLGREVSAPIDIMLGRDPPPETKAQCYVAYVEWLRQALDDAFGFARDKLNLSIQRQDRYYRSQNRSQKIEAGSYVWYYYLPSAKKKLSKHWSGPYKVLQRISDVTVMIEKDTKKKIVHIDNLKSCEAELEADTRVTVEPTTDTAVGFPETLGRGQRTIRPPERFSP